MSEIVPTFHGELQLAGWSESHNGGCKVTFWLQSSEDLDAFRALTVRKGNTAGQRFMAALVEVGDDEQPIQPNAAMGNNTAKGGALARLAAQLGADPEFRRFIEARDEQHAAELIRKLCRVESRAELDNSAEAAAEFHRAIRGPWIKYRERRGLK